MDADDLFIKVGLMLELTTCIQHIDNILKQANDPLILDRCKTIIEMLSDLNKMFLPGTQLSLVNFRQGTQQIIQELTFLENYIITKLNLSRN